MNYSFRKVVNKYTSWKTIGILLLALGSFLWAFWPKGAESTYPSIFVHPGSVLTLSEPSKETIEEMIMRIAKEEGYKAPLFAISVAKCESKLDPQAIGDSGKSRGLWQIHKPSHPTITDEQAFDPEWSTHWAMGKFAKGQARLWTCARIMG